MKGIIVTILLTTMFYNSGTTQQETIEIWGEHIPNQLAVENNETQVQDGILWIEHVQVPTLEVFLPVKQNATGQAIIICPGGGYAGLAYDWEGSDIAKWLNTKGIAAFVLKYRLPDPKSQIVPHQAPLMDAQRAIRLVRKNASVYGITPDEIGIMGFSAGGHLASTLATHYLEQRTHQDEIDKVSAKPNFVILIYPVITMTDLYTHGGSKTNLLGQNPSQELVGHYSNELHITAETPPTFLIHSSDDKGVPSMNSILFYKALMDHNIDTEMHIYPEGGHGYALAVNKGHLQTWSDNLAAWLNRINQ